MFNPFKKKAALTVKISLHDLPPHKMYSVSVTFFKVAANTSPPPFAGDPPIEKWKDTESVKQAEEADDKALHLHLQKYPGFYYAGISIIAYIEGKEKMYAQVERFFPLTRPFELRSGVEQKVELTTIWPDIPLEKLHYYETFHPKKS